MKKLITFLLTIIFITSITACSESPDKLYGFYKDINEKRDSFGYIKSLTISEKEIYSKNWDFGVRKINKIYKDNDCWIIECKHNLLLPNEKEIIKLKIIDDNTIEHIINEKSAKKYIRISEDEYKNILNTPEVKPFPKLF